MKINIIKDEKNFRFLFIELYFPIIGRINRFNEWTDQYFFGFKMSFPTEIYYLNDKEDFWHFALTFLGFGFRLVNQHGY
jgi:hypothetical protein